jgi:acyl carrier protein
VAYSEVKMNLEKLAKIIAENVECDVETIKEETTFENLGIDSLATVELVMQLEEELGYELELDEKLLTVGDLLKFITKKHA